MKTLTANRLTDGRVIYRTADGQWTTQLDEAQRLSPEEAAELLPVAEAEFGIAVGPYIIDLDEAGPAGQKWRRESIRLAGPTTGTTHVLGAA
ncbi:DUF2849 domain-containing protein [Maricaulis sp.]|uniref:DUF2849 domain-containing protein n=1 Tax=Maricaulis sp. TaxID=1486257 RepID=UPI0026105144|nr:DUF2849 domain-containing protein [Maricaulis sp.]